MPGHRTPRKGLPKKPLRTERLDKVKQIRLLMSTGRWRGEVTREALRVEWKMSEHTVRSYAEEASRSIQLDAEEGAEELMRRLYEVTQGVMAGCLERASDENVPNKEYTALSATALQAASGMAALLGKNPEAFMHPKTRTGGGGGATGKPQGPNVLINVNVKRPEPPPAAAPEAVPTSPAPPAPAGAAATPPGDKPPTG